MLERQVRSQSVGPLLAVVRSRGGDATALRERFNLSEKVETDTDLELPVSVLRGLFDAAAVLVGDPNVGMHAALAVPKGRYGLVEYAAFSAPTLWHGLECLARFSALISRASVYQLTRTRTGVQISHVVRGSSDGLGRQVNEFTVTSFVQMSRAAVRAPIAPRRVWFAHPAPPQLDEHRAVFGTEELLFNADTSGVDFDAALADAPMPSADPYLLGLVEKQAAIELANQPSDETLTSRAHVVIREKVRTGAPTVGAVASALRMSPRTHLFLRREEQRDVELAEAVGAAPRPGPVTARGQARRAVPPGLGLHQPPVAGALGAAVGSNGLFF
jgi:hypothetical protein